MKRSIFVLVFMAMAAVLVFASGASSQGAGSAASGGSTYTFEFYDQAANYMGLQTGWFAKIMKDKFNLVQNIIAPQTAGDGKQLYQTRSSTGNLGDIILLDNADFIDCINAGLIKDITQAVKDYPYLMKLVNDHPAVKTWNNAVEGNSGKIYGFPLEIATTSPTGFSEELPSTSPLLPWDYYTGIGRPAMRTLDDLLDVLDLMIKKYPSNPAGDKAYPISLWNSWDSNSGIENVLQLTKWYGQEVNGSISIDYNGVIKDSLDDAGAYRKIVNFFYKANQRGLVDPDSFAQTWDSVNAKHTAKRVYLLWNIWMRGFWNTTERANQGSAYITIPIADMAIYQPADMYFGDGRVWGIGSKVSEANTKRLLEYMNWLASPEGLTIVHSGLKDFNYTVGSNGKYNRINENALMDNQEVPAVYGGGGYADGMNAMNQWLISSVSINPETGESYVWDYWSSTIEKNKTKMTNEWAAQYGASNVIASLQDKGILKVVPNVNAVLPSDPTDIALIRGQCGTILKDYSWRLIFAGNDAEFNSIWTDMKRQMTGLGWNDLVAFDTKKFQKIVDMRNAALGR
jgi:multiple sugar transport system substrate-binding protein/putative aldouronate transport system substrate-binding protein